MSGVKRDDDGKYPVYAWPGGYPIYYLTADGGTLCATCANSDECREAENDPEADPHWTKQWRIVAHDVNWESRLDCDNCNELIESAYPVVEDDDGAELEESE